MPSFGQHTGRPGGEPPPRRQLTPEEIRVRETFNRAEHLARNGAPAPESPRAEVPATFDEQQIRAALAQVGLDLIIFPLGEKPADPTGRNQYREGRLAELESERGIIRQKLADAEGKAAAALRTVDELKEQIRNLEVCNDTLQQELESLKQPAAQEA